jgi:AraC-like DNA-binding protein
MKAYNTNGKDNERRKVLALYIQATGCGVEMFDHNFQPQGTEGKGSVEQNICQHCACRGIKCRVMHENTMSKAGWQGCSLVYQCELGLAFWVSPIYNGSALNGFLRGSGYASDVDELATDESAIASKCNGTITPQEFARRICEIPRGDTGRIQSLAEMLLLCAQSLSGGNENHHETLRQRSGQMAVISTLVEELKAQHPEGSALPAYPLDKERRLIAVLRRGDKDEADKLLCELLAALVFCNPDRFQHVQLRALELAVLLARAGMDSIAATENNARFITQIQEAKTIEELSGSLHSMVENIAEQITLYRDIPHASSLRKAERYIRENLTRKIRLREIAKVAGLSAPYFSTIFKEEMGENLSRYINRLRVEMAGKMLLETSLPLNEIACECCFDDQSWFSKIFKSFTGISPGKYRSQGGMAQVAENSLGVCLT